MPKTAELARQIQQHHRFHTMDLGDGLVTQGRLSAQRHARWRDTGHTARPSWMSALGMESGRSWPRRWAPPEVRRSRSLHLATRLSGRQAYYEKSVAEGLLPDPDMIDRGFLMDGLPGKRGFDLVHQYLDSKVEAVADDLMTICTFDDLGQFDVVFYFGVLYHMANPIGALKRLRQVTGTVAVIETAAIEVPALPDKSLIEFFPGSGAPR